MYFRFREITFTVDLLPRRVVVVSVQLLDRLLDPFLVLQHRAEHLFEARLALLDTGK